MSIKKYIINDEFDLEKVALATLKKVFSPTLFPRVLTNLKNNVLINNFENLIDFVYVSEQKSQNFAKITHTKCFDLGLFFDFFDDCYILKLYDGNGILASSFVTNIFDKIFSLNKEDFLKEKNFVLNSYKKLNKEKLLKQF